MRKILLMLSMLSTIAVAESELSILLMDNETEKHSYLMEENKSSNENIGVLKLPKEAQTPNTANLKNDSLHVNTVHLISSMSSIPYIPRINYIVKISDIPLVCEKIARPVMIDDETSLALRASCVSVLTSFDNYEDENYLIRVRVDNLSKECEKMKVMSNELLSHASIVNVGILPNKLKSNCLLELAKLEIKKL